MLTSMAVIRERLKIVGVDCPSCVYSINRELAKLNCIQDFSVDVASGEALVEYDDAKCSLGDVYRAIRDAGYDVVKEVAVFSVEDLDANLARVLEEKLGKARGVFECRASISTSMIKLVYNPLALTQQDIEKALRGLGVEFKRVLEEARLSTGEREYGLLARRLVAFAIGFSVVLLAILSMLMNVHLGNYVYLLAVSSLVVLTLSYDIVLRGYRSLLRFAPTMDSFVALSSTISFLFGILFLLNVIPLRGEVHVSSFFEASAGVLGFVGLGLYLEERIRKRAWRSVEEHVKKLYGKAKLISNEGVIEVDADSVPLGALVEVKAGEIIPVDGVVVEGEGYVDESSFTGEPMPIHKKASTRDPVLAGSKLVSGYMRIRATRVGRETILYKIVETIREAQFYKPKIVRLADKIVGYFTLAVIGIVAATATYWSIYAGDVSKAVLFVAAVFATACPCAIGIAIPMAVSVAVLTASRRGIVIRRGDVFDRVLEASVAVFDKTGTLTTGSPAVRRVMPLNNDPDISEVLSYVCSVESRSEHPIAKAILNYCSEKRIELKQVEEFEHFPGLGVVGRVNGLTIAVGSTELMDRVGVDLPGSVEKLLKEIGERGGTPIIAAVEGRPIAVIEISDSLRPEAVDVVKYLKSLGLRVGIASGDVQEAVKHYAEILKIDFYYYKLKPLDKVDVVKRLQLSGEKVMYVGDGINDAAAISVAHVGVAMGGGADISKEAGDVVITSNKLSDVVFLVEFSRRVRRKFLENLFWALIYNTILLPIAAGALYSYGIFIKPELGAIVMVLSDVSVVLNSLRLLNVRTQP
ncbi:heavy metal translocating P-type ATPase [Desulfurococcus sp.]|uniref:heavy metal translocating P-type ATPase n=2 Tax=Thermoproteota TaxID=28889 RepID=UPI003161886F